MNIKPVTMSRRVCAHCHRGFEMPVWLRPEQACCSLSCARKRSPALRAHLRRIAQRGGKVGGAARRAKAAARWAVEAQQLTPGELAKNFYQRGYKNAYRVGLSAGYEQGYDAALTEMRQRA